MSKSLRVGFVVNPYAGVGGPAALKGSDGDGIRMRAIGGELDLRAPQRASLFLSSLLEGLLQARDRIQPDSSIATATSYDPSDTELQTSPRIDLITVAGAMGADYLNALNIASVSGSHLKQEAEKGSQQSLAKDSVQISPPGMELFSTCILSTQLQSPSSPKDTHVAVAALQGQNLDLLVFVGGDGTARDVLTALDSHKQNLAVLGVPSGVKMHSGVFAINPQLAAELVIKLAAGALVGIAPQEVRDIDEEACRQNRVASRYFGELQVPFEAEFVQHVKQGGLESEPLVLSDIADYLEQSLEQDCLLIVGPGSSTQNLVANWGLEGSLLGVDVIQNRQYRLKDANARELEKLVSQQPGPVLLLITVIGGQGYIIGRGNQQLSPSLLKHLGLDRICVIATKTKLQSLAGRPLLVDSGDPYLDQTWHGYLPILCGYDERVLYPLGRQVAKGGSEID